MKSKAEEIARVKHRDQVDKSGAPYIIHVERVVERVSPEAKDVAWLHDVLEDTNLLPADLALMGIPADVVKSVYILTRRKGLPYFQYISRLIATRDVNAMEVKKADLADHLAFRDAIPESLAERYEKALRLFR